MGEPMEVDGLGERRTETRGVYGTFSLKMRNADG
jgi:hypothetical protein